MKSVCSIKIKRLGKYEKEWRRKLEEERLAVDPLTRFERENKKLIADNMRLGTTLDWRGGGVLSISYRIQVLFDSKTGHKNPINSVFYKL